MKLLISDKDNHIIRLQSQLKSINEHIMHTPRDTDGYCSTEIVKSLLNSIKSMQTSLHSQIKIKEEEVDQLTKY